MCDWGLHQAFLPALAFRVGGDAAGGGIGWVNLMFKLVQLIYPFPWKGFPNILQSSDSKSVDTALFHYLCGGQR